MNISARVIADSISPEGARLTTMEWKYPRFIHGEVMTHRMLSRNAASSRAIPVQKLIDQVRNNPAMPTYWGKNQPGMQAKQKLGPEEQKKAEYHWLKARDSAVEHAEAMMAVGLHKQTANRILEPWMIMTIVVSATDWGNVYHLRIHEDAQPEFKVLAESALTAHQLSVPKLLQPGEWHLPFILDVEYKLFTVEQLRRLSVARCARVSFLNHDGTAPVPAKDYALHDQLIAAPHASPFEHVATPKPGRHGNFNGYEQYRKLIPNENIVTYPGL